MKSGLRPPVIELERVEASRSGRAVLGPLDFHLMRGDALLLTGPNGSGKTTLLLLVLGLLKATSGRVSVMGARVHSREWRKVRRRVGYVNQASVETTLPIAAREVVEIGVAGSRESRAERRARVEAAMRRTGCLELGSRAYRELSGGEKQRVDIARCIAQEPEVLLLDEPASSLDPEAKRDLGLLLEALHAQGLTLLAVTHEKDSFPAWPSVTLEGGRIAGASG